MRHAALEQLDDGPEVELPYNPVQGLSRGELLQKKVGDRWVIGYLAADQTCGSTDDLMGDCMGNLYSLHRHAPQGDHEKVYEALGLDPDGSRSDDGKPNPDAVVLDCYDHSGQRWSVTGEGMQCRWDTARGAGVWLPDECLLDELKDLTGEARRARCVEFCGQFLEQYNAILEGDVWGVVVAWYDADGKEIDHEAVWGHIGGKWAKESLAENFKGTCESLQKEMVAA